MGSIWSLRSAALVGIVALALSSQPTAAQPGMMTPGSALIFPLIDYSQPARTIITVTNTNTDQVICGSGFRRGDVILYFQFRNGANCLVFDRREFLSPGDTLSVRADEFVLGSGAGEDWMIVVAQDPATNQPIDFDFLIGSANFGELRSNSKWWYGAYSFKSLRAEGGSPFGVTGCGHAFVDPANDLFVDFNGAEYAGFPQRLMLDFFVGEGQPAELPNASIVSSRLVLMSPPSTTPATPTIVTMFIRNNNEVAFSNQFQFTCLIATALAALTNAARESILRTSYDAGELGGLPTGWITMSGDNGILGVFSQRVTKPDGTPIQAFGRPLHFDGVRLDVRLRR